MKRFIFLALALTSCSLVKQPEAKLDSVLVNLDGVDHKVPLEKSESVALDKLSGACIAPDLKHARLLLKGKDCDDGWIAVKGSTAQ